MVTAIIILIYMGSYISYCSSKEASVNTNLKINEWLLKHFKVARYGGFLLLLASSFASVYHFGTTAGILYCIITITTVMGLIVVFSPLQQMGYKQVLILFILLLLLEFTF